MTHIPLPFRILILCTGNSCRSQMAESIINTMAQQKQLPIHAYSAGVKPASRVHPKSLLVLKEKGYISDGLFPKDVEYFAGEKFDLVVTVCNNAQERCPFFAGATRQIHQPFDDPYEAQGSEEEIADVYRRVRDELEAWAQTLVVQLLR